MKFTTKCPKCGKVFNLDQKHDAQKAKCVCGEIFTVTSSPNKLPLYHNNQPDVDDMSESNSSTLKAIVFASVIVLIVVVLIFKFSFPDRKHKHEDNSDTLHETVAIQLAVEKHERNFQPETQRVAIDQLNCDQSNTQQTMAERNFKEQQEKERQKIAEEQQLKKQFPNIDLAWTNLPSNFTGHDIKSLYGAFSQKNIADIATKDKFETEEQYMERLKKSLPVHLLGELSTDSLLGFMLPKEKYGDRWEYAAEKQVYEYSFPMSDQKEWAGKAEIKIAEKKSDSKYCIGSAGIGQIAFPVK